MGRPGYSTLCCYVFFNAFYIGAVFSVLTWENTGTASYCATVAPGRSSSAYFKTTSCAKGLFPADAAAYSPEYGGPRPSLRAGDTSHAIWVNAILAIVAALPIVAVQVLFWGVSRGMREAARVFDEERE